MPTANNDLFSINKIVHEDGIISATLGINPESEILKGHFPGQPVVPGACMLQIVKEVLESALNQTFRLKKADQLKFMIMIDPANTLTVTLDMSYQYTEDGTVSVSAKLSNADVVYFKFFGSFAVQ
jgi:3-hydroxyacyl-[acyl-carrier-protein] dehydratase